MQITVLKLLVTAFTFGGLRQSGVAIFRPTPRFRLQDELCSRHRLLAIEGDLHLGGLLT